MDLKDKRAFITGGTSGMGIGAARSMAEKGASVILTGRDETRGVTAVEEIRAGGQDAEFIAADLSEMSEVGRIADAAGEIDVLVDLPLAPAVLGRVDNAAKAAGISRDEWLRNAIDHSLNNPSGSPAK